MSMALLEEVTILLTNITYVCNVDLYEKGIHYQQQDFSVYVTVS